MFWKPAASRYASLPLSRDRGDRAGNLVLVHEAAQQSGRVAKGRRGQSHRLGRRARQRLLPGDSECERGDRASSGQQEAHLFILFNGPEVLAPILLYCRGYRSQAPDLPDHRREAAGGCSPLGAQSTDATRVSRERYTSPPMSGSLKLSFRVSRWPARRYSKASSSSTVTTCSYHPPKGRRFQDRDIVSRLSSRWSVFLPL